MGYSSGVVVVLSSYFSYQSVNFYRDANHCISAHQMYRGCAEVIPCCIWLCWVIKTPSYSFLIADQRKIVLTICSQMEKKFKEILIGFVALFTKGRVK